MAIKADRLPADLNAADDLKDWLRLPLRVADVVRRVAVRRRVVLLIDQLDSVSELTDRKSNRLNLLLNLSETLVASQTCTSLLHAENSTTAMAHG